MKISTLCMLCLIGILVVPQETDAWWRRRRRRSAPVPVPVERIPPVFDVSCPINLGTIRTTTLPKTVTWTAPTATDEDSPPVKIERRGAGPGSSFAEGDQTITYQAGDTIPNYSLCEVKFTIVLIKCSTLSHITSGYVSCTEGNRVDSRCRYSCFQGYTLTGGSTERSCDEQNGVGVWSGSQPSCVELTCDASVVSSAPENGQVSCTNSNVFQSVCSYSCSAGYTIPAGQTRDRLCSTSGWTGAMPECEDTSAPGFDSCPSSQVIYAEAQQETGVASWTPPTAIDNSGAVISDVTQDGPAPGSTLPQGHYVVTYSATDEGGNVGTCVFTITVQVIHCSTIPISPGLLVSCGHGNLRGSVCAFSCSLGYRLVGSASSTCERNSFSGSWTDQAPTCEELLCPSIEPPEDGDFLDDLGCPTSYGTSCYFECVPGFQINNNVLRCSVQAGSEVAFWEGITPQCEVETCERPNLSGPLEVPDNSSVCGLQVQVPAGDECEFDCGPGYYIQGSTVVTCGLTGAWAQTLPTCEAVTCLGSNLPAPMHGGKSGCPHDREQYGAVCTLFCDLGYEASEATPIRRVCQDDRDGGGVWSGGPISCSVVQCQPLPSPSNGYLDSCQLAGAPNDPTVWQDYSTTCVTLCNEGYTATGATTRRCLAEGLWDGAPQSCIDLTAPVVQCPVDTVIIAEPGQSVGTIRWENLEPVYASDAGAMFVAQLESIDSTTITGSRPTTLAEGDHTLVYRASDEAGNTDTCSFNVEVRVVRCPPLFAPSNGQITLEQGQGSCGGGAVLGSACQVTCSHGYNLQSEGDSENLTCGQSEGGTTVGVWNGTVPLCQIAMCDVPAPSNSSVQGCPFETASFGDQCQFTCDDGFMTSTGTSSSSRTCQADGTLSGEGLICGSVVTCPTGFSLEHGAILPSDCTADNDRLPYDTLCNFHCNSGFLQYGPFVKGCMADGTWSDDRPVTCEDRQEPAFDDPCPRYVSVNADRGALTSIVDFALPTVTDNSGNSTVKIIAGNKGPNSTFSEGTTVTTYVASDPSGNTARCQIEINVNVFRCPRLQAPASGSLVNCSDPIFGSTCSFACNHGYELNGPVTRTCELTSGQAPAYWDGNQPTCQPRTCPALPVPPLAVMSGCSQSSSGEVTFGTLCTFYCPYGYGGVGESQKRCQADGSWSSLDYACQATACDPLAPPQGATISLANCETDPRFGETCLLQCATAGFQVQPQTLAHTNCLGTGAWSRNISAAACVDVQEPAFTACPNDFNVYAAEGELLGNVTWSVEASDNDPTAATNEVTCDKVQGLWAEGDYDVTCTATDNSQNSQTCSFEVSVRVRRCQQLNPPVFGHVIGSCDNIWGSECQVDCAVGYTLVGPDQTICEYTGSTMRWARDSVPYCDIVGCDPLVLPNDVINVYPSTCTTAEKLYYGTECTFFCRDGLTLEGDITSVSCGANGAWSTEIGAVDVTCIDTVAPTLLSCPGPQSVVRTEVWGVEVTFDLPVAQDNADENLNVTTDPADLTSPFNFTDDAVVSYTFTDAAGNFVTCSFAIYVQDEIPPVVVFCPPDMSMNTSETLTSVTWDPPVFEEVTGDDLLITSNYDNHMATLPWGEHVVNYQATNSDNGQTVGCQFTIEIVPVTCKDLQAPVNGGKSCDQWAYGRFCSIFCNANFDIPRLPSSKQPPVQYVCGSSGLWSPHAYVPGCSVARRAGTSRLPSELLYFTGDCGTPETRQAIADAFLQLLQTSDYSDVCTQSDECTADNVQVTCGPTGRRRRSIDVQVDVEKTDGQQRWRIFHEANEDGLLQSEKQRSRRRPKQQHQRSRRAVTGPYTVSVVWDFIANVPQDPSLDNFDATIEAEDVMIAMSDKLLAQIDGGTFPDFSDVSGMNLTLDAESLTYNYAEVICGHGLTEDNDDLQCVPCVAGTFYDNVTQVCQLCPRGQYQEDPGQSACLQCPVDTWTTEEGTTNATQCLDICEAGYFSVFGVAPCQRCAVGTYQPSTLSASCLACPNGTTTLEPASTQSTQCKEPCEPGSHAPFGFAPCDPCPLGLYQSLSQQAACEPCPGNLTTNSTGATSIAECADINECASNPCQNAGTCVDLFNSYQCLCVDGFTGSDCEIDIDECALYHPCQHNGTCTDLVNGYSCACLARFTGDDCEVSIDLCQSAPCQNNATCVTSPTGYMCQCINGYHGNHCELMIHPCSPTPCLNGASCRVLVGDARGYECECAAGFAGINCSRDINECLSQPCRNGGTCQDMVNGFQCTCTNGYTGAQCDVDIDLCANNPCLNNGSCFDLGNSVECLCQSNFAGDHCERPRDICDEQPCSNGGNCSVAGDTNQDYVCECAAGFQGRNCEYKQDNCASSPCSNEGTCVDQGDEFWCICPLGITGATCDIIIDQCTPNPCNNGTCIGARADEGFFQCICFPGVTGEDCSELIDFCARDNVCHNGGTCASGEEGYSCKCPLGFQGLQCEFDVNECASEPCLHGSTCYDLRGSFSCVCAAGFTGTLCDQNIDDCSPDPCVNGTCVDGVGVWSCDCFQGYTGDSCDIPVDYCSEEPCLNNAICTSLATGYSCTCLSGYTGATCQTNIEECRSFPCFHGDCIDHVDAYSCVCDLGYTGVNCEVDLDECAAVPCQHNGTCIDGPGLYTCQCAEGFEGNNCEIDVDECANVTCENGGVCVDGIASYSCTCPEGYSGPLCQLDDTPACSTHPCLNGGLCVAEQGGNDYRCVCLAGFAGDLCGQDIDECNQNRCQNEATCLDQINGYICTCPQGYNGTYCEQEINECESQPCLNGATCQEQVAGFRCICPSGYTGEICENNIDECRSNPCQNLADCEDRINGFLCHCGPGYQGEFCSEETDECDSDPCLNGGNCVDSFLQYVCECAAGFTGVQCESALPSDFDLIFNGESRVVQLAEVSAQDINNLTVSMWMFARRSSADFDLFAYRVGDVEFSLRNPCSIRLMSGSTTHRIGTSLCDGAWHHIAVTWSLGSTVSWAFSTDQSPPITGTDTMATDISAAEGVIEIGSDSLTQRDYVLISSYNVWSSELSDESLETLTTTCHPALFGDLVSWTDVVSLPAFAPQQDLISRQIQSPSLCDAADECLSNPCDHGSCENKLGSYHCECEQGYQGEQCEQSLDLCIPESCENDGTCSTVEGSPICECLDGFSGEFCEVQKIDGGWAGWSIWSECTVTCGGGTRTRDRQCTDPAPQGGGLNCTGKDFQEETCNSFTCPGCLRVRRPFKGQMDCEVDEERDRKTCTISCRHGYGFAEQIQDDYWCGIESNYRWSHQTANNPRAMFPSCTKLSPNKGATGVVTVSYPGVLCASASDKESLLNAAYTMMDSHSNDIDCVNDGTCQIQQLTVLNCQLQTNRRRSVRAAGDVAISLVVTQNATFEDPLADLASENETEPEPLEPLDIFYANLTSLITNGSLDLVVNDQVIAVDPTSVTADAWENCPMGYHESATEGFCVPCSVGTYFGKFGNDTEYGCYPCPADTYQDQEAQDDCILCPDDTFTDGQHASNVTDCQAEYAPPTEVPPSPHLFPIYIVIGIVIGAIVFLMFIGCAVWLKVRSRQKLGSEAARDIQLLNAAAPAEDRGYGYVYNPGYDHQDPNANANFISGAKASSGDDSGLFNPAFERGSNVNAAFNFRAETDSTGGGSSHAGGAEGFDYRWSPSHSRKGSSSSLPGCPVERVMPSGDEPTLTSFTFKK